mgnify:CR=1 FL=1
MFTGKQKLIRTVNAEEGLLGICKDPNFAKNNWVYIFIRRSIHQLIVYQDLR